MNIIPPHIIDDLFGGSQFPPGSPENNNWNNAYNLLWSEGGKQLLGILSHSYSTLTWQDHQDIVQTVFVDFRRNQDLRKAIAAENTDRLAHANRLLLSLCRWRAENWRRKRTSIRDREGISLDAPLSDDSTDTLGDTIAASDDLLAELEEKEVQGGKKDVVKHILVALVESGARSAETVAIFQALLEDKKPAEVMVQFGVSRGKVDTTKYELTKQIEQITQLCIGGMSLADAIAASATKPKATKKNS